MINHSIAPKSVVIVGGGSAGWMTAAWLVHHLPDTTRIQLVESEKIGTIGVGEGTTPHLRQFFATLGIEETDWMPACEATFKNGITFENWSNEQGPESYFHPFPSASDRHTAMAFLTAVEARRKEQSVEAHPDPYFLAWKLTQSNLSPKQIKTGAPIPLNYAYHFDAGLLGQFIRQWCEHKGVNRVEGKVTQTNQHQDGSIASLEIDTADQPLEAEFFVDCSGFHSLLMQKVLQVPFVSFDDCLLNDSAVTMPGETLSPLTPQTVSCAMDSGWRWQIPLRHRTGHGYVYSSHHCESLEAEDALAKVIGSSRLESDPRHLKLRVGRLSTNWHKNCLAVGLSQGFVEPLEATALHVVQVTLSTYTRALAEADIDAAKRMVNQVVEHKLEGIKDYIVAHYRVSPRRDTAYWIDASQNIKVPERVKEILSCWDSGGNIIELINGLGISDIYHPISWYCLLSGYGRLPIMSSAAAHPAQTKIEQQLTSWQKRFIDHEEFIFQ